MADFWIDKQDGDVIEADEFNTAFSEIDKKMKLNASGNTQTAKALSTHILDESNPHNVTAEQTGAYEKDSVYNKTEIDSKLVLAGTNEETVDLTTVTDSSGAISPEVTSSTLVASGGPFRITLDNTKSYRIKGVFEGHYSGYVQIDGNYLFNIENGNEEFTKTFDYVGSVGTITVYSGFNFNCTFEEFVAITPHDGFMSASDKAKLDGLPNDAYSKHETDSKIDLLSLKAEKNGETIRISDAYEPEQTADVTLTSDTVTDFSAVSVKKYGKNLINYPYAETTKTVNGVTFTDNGDGSITANGTAISDIVYELGSSMDMFQLPNGNYFFSGCPSGGGSSAYYLSAVNGSGISYTKFIRDFGNGAMLNSEDELWKVAIRISSGVTVNNLVFKPQIELGNAATDYEPYKAPVTYTPDSDGKVSGVTLGSDTATLTTDTDGVIINAKYKKDITKAFAQLEEKINSLSSVSTVANVETL